MPNPALAAADGLLAKYQRQQTAAALLANFPGRPDAYAVQFDGAAGLGPVRKPIGADVLEAHLDGKKAAGFYVCDADSHCRVTCADVDNKAGENPEWRDQVERLVDWLEGAGLYPFVEISQSGSGAHVWLALEDWTAAALVRRFWKAAEKHSGVTLREVFPKQDTIKDLGNLVRYPLWNQSEFVALPDWEIIEPLTALEAIRTQPASELEDVLTRLGVSPIVQTTEAVDIPEGLPATVAKAVASEHTLLGRRWRNDVTGLGDPSTSGLAMAIARELIRRYVPTGDVKAALRWWMQKHAPDKAKREDWLDLTISKAFQFVVEKPETLSFESTTVAQAVDTFLAGLKLQKRRHFRSGIKAVDDSIEGVSPGEVAVIAARPGNCKTALALEWMDYASLEVPGLIISEEMAALELGRRRAMSISARHESEWPANLEAVRLEAAAHHGKRKPVWIVENAATVERVEEIIDQYAAKEGVKIVAVDYLQLLSSRDARNDRDAATKASKAIKQAAKRNGVAVLELAQLNRAIEGRDSGEPKMSDLRDSGQIEQDADLILFGRWFFTENPDKYDKTHYTVYAKKRRNGHIRSPEMDICFDSDRQKFS